MDDCNLLNLDPQVGCFPLIYALASGNNKNVDFTMIPLLISLAFLGVLALELVDQTLCY